MLLRRVGIDRTEVLRAARASRLVRNARDVRARLNCGKTVGILHLKGVLNRSNRSVMDSSSAYGGESGTPTRNLRPARSSFVRRSLVRAIVTGLLVLGVAAPAAAAGLGGLSSGGPGADGSAVESCDSDGIRASYLTGTSAAGGPIVTAAVISGMHSSCTGSMLHVTLSGSAGSALSSGSARALGGTQTVTMTTPADATAVTGAAVVVTG